MSVSNQNKINQLLLLGQPGGLYFTEWLNKQGYSNQLLKKYRESGWLNTLSRGVMYRPDDSLSAYMAIANYNRQLGRNLRVAAHSALELSGYNHYVPMGKPLLVVFHPKQHVPEWMNCNVFDRTFKLFSTDTFIEPQITTVKIHNQDMLISTPEQAFFECLLLAPLQYAYMDLFYIMEQLTALRFEVVQTLLETTKSIKVKRMFLYMAEKANHYWYNMLDTAKIDLGTSKIQLAEKGAYIAKYKITVPKELHEYE